MFKKYLDISINYREIIDSVIKSLSNEIEDCIKCILKLKELKLASPKMFYLILLYNQLFPK